MPSAFSSRLAASQAKRAEERSPALDVPVASAPSPSPVQRSSGGRDETAILFDTSSPSAGSSVRPLALSSQERGQRRTSADGEADDDDDMKEPPRPRSPVQSFNLAWRFVADPVRSGDDDRRVGELLTLLAKLPASAPLENVESIEKAVVRFLTALMDAYNDVDFQSEIAFLIADTGDDELKYLRALGPIAAKAQAPVFKRFGISEGSLGVAIMKAGTRRVALVSATVEVMAGDLRELLGLPRQEQDMASQFAQVQTALGELISKIKKAPLDLRAPLAQSLGLPSSASAEELAREVPRFRMHAEGMAERQLARGHDKITGPGSLLGPELLGRSETELREAAIGNFERYLQKMLARIVTPVDSFTTPPQQWRCKWADAIIQEQHVRELWGCEPAGPASPRSAGVTIIDEAVEQGLVRRVLDELKALEQADTLTTSRDPCNVGARSVWLHFESEEERQHLRPALLEICQLLAGLPFALEACATNLTHCGLEAPSLRVHPHVMAATYRRGAEYHIHKDSYNGTDNQRMVTILLYLNDVWCPHDGGELRIFGRQAGPPGSAPAEESDYMDIAPLPGRLVMFRSRDVWHAVREPREQRWALTLWVMAE